ncbi:hypothetical protein MPDQ_004971 [Monascus purpureus]|uniref:Haloacid dehalogenase-like hydrolase n=1 Tax=Monascus purpureus TaxID=5098 RepID=A0A507R160_MONPU|nr:hypothetical protein MPDQ_004971 [Monascus purpureus]BDD54504.1 hypothetical protein MAP00_000119 [Monascus purpureus]
MAASTSQPLRVHLICDFDGTIAQSSTLSILARVGYHRNPTARPWSEITSAYMRDLQHHRDTYTNTKLRTTKNRNDGIHEELAYLDSLRPVERASIERIEAAGVFKDVTPADLSRGASKAVREGKITFRSGWDRLVQDVRATGGWTEVISVNWSRVFIRAAIDAAFPAALLAGSPDSDFKIAANDIMEDGSGGITRPFRHPDGGIWTAEDKMRLVKETLDAYPRTIYVGDSVTDLRCLLEKRIVGIIVRDEEMTFEQKELKEILDKSGIVVKHVSEWDEEEWSSADPSQLYWARDFGEICDSPLFARS